MASDACDVQVSDCGVAEFLSVAAKFGTGSYGFAVTPNVDHLIRYRTDARFREIYGSANFVLLDSRFLARMLRLTTGLRLPTCPGSDLTAGLFESVIGPDDPLVLIGCSASAAQILCTRYGLTNLQHYNPPMGFIENSTAIEECLRFIERASPFRFCLLAVGSPQQERLAQLLMTRGRARGLALCIGGSVNFLTGSERRAPLWMQNLGLEWLHRLMLNPPRMFHRYVVRGPRIFFLLPSMKFVLRPVPNA